MHPSPSPERNPTDLSLPVASPVVSAALTDPDPVSRCIALRGLTGSSLTPELSAHLLQMVRYDEFEVAKAASESLGHLQGGSEIIRLLLADSGSREQYGLYLVNSLTVLARKGDADALRQIADAARSPEDSSGVRDVAARALIGIARQSGPIGDMAAAQLGSSLRGLPRDAAGYPGGEIEIIEVGLVRNRPDLIAFALEASERRRELIGSIAMRADAWGRKGEQVLQEVALISRSPEIAEMVLDELTSSARGPASPRILRSVAVALVQAEIPLKSARVRDLVQRSVAGADGGSAEAQIAVLELVLRTEIPRADILGDLGRLKAPAAVPMIERLTMSSQSPTAISAGITALARHDSREGLGAWRRIVDDARDDPERERLVKSSILITFPLHWREHPLQRSEQVALLKEMLRDKDPVIRHLAERTWQGIPELGATWTGIKLTLQEFLGRK